MDGDGVHAEHAQEECEAAGGVAGAREDDGGGALQLGEHVDGVAVLVLGGDEEVLLPQSGHGGVLAGHLHLDRVAQAGALQLGHLAGHGGAVQLGAPVPGDGLQDLVNLLLKVQAQDAVRLVQDQVLQLLQREALRVGQVVHHPTGRAHYHVRPLGQRDGLRHRIHAPDQRGGAHPHRRAQRLKLRVCE